jgi:hypothetical protein
MLALPRLCSERERKGIVFYRAQRGAMRAGRQSGREGKNCLTYKSVSSGLLCVSDCAIAAAPSLPMGLEERLWCGLCEGETDADRAPTTLTITF